MGGTPNLGPGGCPGDDLHVLGYFGFVLPGVAESPGDPAYHDLRSGELRGRQARPGAALPFPFSPLEGRCILGFSQPVLQAPKAPWASPLNRILNGSAKIGLTERSPEVY